MKIIAALLVAGCGEQTAPQAPASASAPVVPVPATSLGQRLGDEAAARPAGAIRVEDLVAALQGRGVEVARTRQVLAAPVGARYCATALTRRGLALAVCEFDSATAAGAGRERSRSRFDSLVPGRTLVAAGASLLTIAPHNDPGLDREAGLAAESFAALGHHVMEKGE